MVYPHRQPHTPRPILNAIPARPQPSPDRAGRRARHLRLCEELIELGMTLARAAAKRAQDDIAAPPPVAAIPGSSAAAIAQAEDLGRRRAPDYGKLFTHLSRAVRQTMLLETYIAEGHPSAPTRIASHSPAPNAAATPHPDRDVLKRETLERLDCALPLRPGGEVAIEDLLIAIARKFGLDAGPVHQPDAAKPEASRPQNPPGPASPAGHIRPPEAVPRPHTPDR